MNERASGRRADDLDYDGCSRQGTFVFYFDFFSFHLFPPKLHFFFPPQISTHFQSRPNFYVPSPPRHAFQSSSSSEAAAAAAASLLHVAINLLEKSSWDRHTKRSLYRTPCARFPSTTLPPPPSSPNQRTLSVPNSKHAFQSVPI